MWNRNHKLLAKDNKALSNRPKIQHRLLDSKPVLLTTILLTVGKEHLLIIENTYMAYKM